MDHEVGGAASMDATSSVAVRLVTSLTIATVSEVTTGALALLLAGPLWPIVPVARKRILEFQMILICRPSEKRTFQYHIPMVLA